jgi:AcrR family transcriptional regulator
MDGHERRRQRIKDRIKKSALELFTSYGADKVSMDEIAARARVSKVTIYKYFHSKEELRKEIISLYVEDILAATESVLDSDLDFLEKLNITLVANLNAPQVAEGGALFDFLETGSQVKGESLQEKLREIMYRFYEEGKREGYIDEELPFDLLYLYQQIFQAGFKAKLEELQPILTEPDTLEKFLHLYFFGFIHKK